MSHIAQQMLNDTCLPGPIGPDLWNSLQLDQYLANYPGGQNLTLSVSLVGIRPV